MGDEDTNDQDLDIQDEVDVADDGAPDGDVVDPPAPAKPKVLAIPTSAMAKIKATERERGRRLALQELNQKARAAGFGSWEELEAAAAAAKAQPAKVDPPQPPADQGKPDDNRYVKKLERDNQRLVERVQLAARSKAEAEKARRVAEKRAMLLETEAELKLAARAAGIRDVKYAVHVLREELAKKTPEELQKFDENKFFQEDLRKMHPALYGVEVRPANTAPVGDTPPPGAQDVPPTNGGGKVDATKLTTDEYHKLLRRRGLAPPGTGF